MRRQSRMHAQVFNLPFQCLSLLLYDSRLREETKPKIPTYLPAPPKNDKKSNRTAVQEACRGGGRYTKTSQTVFALLVGDKTIVSHHKQYTAWASKMGQFTDGTNKKMGQLWLPCVTKCSVATRERKEKKTKTLVDEHVLYFCWILTTILRLGWSHNCLQLPVKILLFFFTFLAPPRILEMQNHIQIYWTRGGKTQKNS